MPDNLKTAFREAVEDIKRLYNADLPLEERKMILAARKELNQLLGLYGRAGGEIEDEMNETSGAELEEIRRHLEPLGLAKEGTPVSELCRLAALKITDFKSTD